jgi:tetratricopeptide (TPR) repeat protein
VKKSILIGLLLGASFSIFAQEGKLVSAWNALESFKKGDGAYNLESALPYINEAIEHESTKGSTKAWWYRSQIYQFISTEPEVKDKHPDAAFEAIRSFQKMKEIDNPKFKDWPDAIKNLQALATSVFNSGVDLFSAKKFIDASKYFSAIEDINNVILAKGGKTNIDLKTAMGNAAIAAENGGIYADAIATYKKLDAAFPESKYYNIMYGIHKKNGNMDDARKIIDEGLLKYPTDKDLLISKVNFYIADGKSGEAIDYLKALVAQDPKNEQLYVALGQAYEQTKDEASAKATYESLIAMNSNSFEGSYGIGAMIFNKAKLLTDEMNALGYSKADQLKYEDLKKKRAVIFGEAKPYLEKALTIKPENQSVQAALKNIELLSK